MKLTDPDAEVLRAYVAARAHDLRLSQWTIHLSDTDAAEDALGSTTTTGGRWIATIFLCPQFRSLSPEEQRNTIIHELLHIPLDGIAAACREVESVLSREGYDLFYAGVRRAIEFTADGIATAIESGFPLIEWP